jgi:hypothetical protein
MTRSNKRFLITQSVVLLLALIGCRSRTGCEAFRIGNFYHPLADGDSAFVLRNDTSQIEMRPGRIARFNVEWIDNCEYEIRLVSFSENGVNMPIPDSLRHVKNRVRIIETSKEFYVFDAKRSDGLEFSDTLWVGGK